jgi:hypothetical protein
LTTNQSNTKTAFIALCNALITGISALPDKTFLLGGQTFTKAQVVAPLQALVDAAAKTAADEATWHTSVQDEHDAEAAAREMVDAVKPFLQGRLGKSSPLLRSQFGLAPVKLAAKTVAAKATGIARSLATRAIRGTRGSKQKKALTAEATPAVAPPAAPTKPTA